MAEGQTPEVSSKSFFRNRYLNATKKQEIHEQFAIDPKDLRGVVFTISERTAKQAAQSGSKKGIFHNSFQSCATTNVTSNRSTMLLDSGFSGIINYRRRNTFRALQERYYERKSNFVICSSFDHFRCR